MVGSFISFMIHTISSGFVNFFSIYCSKSCFKITNWSLLGRSLGCSNNTISDSFPLCGGFNLALYAPPRALPRPVFLLLLLNRPYEFLLLGWFVVRVLIVFVLTDVLLPAACVGTTVIACGTDVATDDGGVITGAGVGAAGVYSAMILLVQRYERPCACVDLLSLECTPNSRRPKNQQLYRYDTERYVKSLDLQFEFA